MAEYNVQNNSNFEFKFLNALDQIEKLNKRLDDYKMNLEALVLEKTKDLTETKEMYETLAKASPIGIFKINEEGKYLYVNKKWQKITGISKKEALNTIWYDVIYPLDRKKVIEHWNKCKLNNKTFSMEFRIKNNNNIRWVLVEANQDYLSKCGAVGTITNITRKKELLPELIKLKASMQG